ncbi:DUF2510 domain-containing protein [Galbitalea sp. SE-J8]|uniref:DUF2510 domain-containing protein n=1 Tax=Galbitalea sp. SE-J8 TaxID=3054952 RepID=UPI00259D1C58|nr:DUF2510 domain-containing protein [Galbitalea sp. SE-J8]MDM4762614.1 DUF2510 domain-containing protein [Galbitalea sp. SE-J8]
MSENVVAPGWYPDPLGLPQQRWWNGSGWTEQVNAPQPPGAPTTVAYAEPEPDVIVINVVNRSASAAAPSTPQPHRGAHVADPRLEIEAPSAPAPTGGAHVAAPRLEIEPPIAQGGAHVAPPCREIDPPAAPLFPPPAPHPAATAGRPTAPAAPSVSFEALFGAPPPAASTRVIPEQAAPGSLDGLPGPRRDQRFPFA